MPTASSPYLMGQSSLNASHDVFMVRTMLFDPSSYLSEVHSFVGDLVLQGVLRGPRAERGQRTMCFRPAARRDMRYAPGFAPAYERGHGVPWEQRL